MKKTIYILFLGVLLAGCNNHEPDVFSLSPALRLEKALTDDQAILQNAGNGWVMEYFANPSSPGYTMLVKFKSNGMAIVSAKNALTLNTDQQTDSCLFQLIGDNGPVLTFNTYNKVLHFFSNPENPDGYGLEGDYEFVVTKATADSIQLQGKKYHSVVWLRKLASATNWSQYLDHLVGLDQILFNKVSLNLTMVIGKATYIFSNGNSHMFSIQKKGNSTSVAAPFIVTADGIRFQTVQEFEGLQFQALKLTADSSALVSVENANLKLVGTSDLAAFILSNQIVWNFTTNAMSPNIKTFYDQVLQDCIAKYGTTAINLSLKYSTNRRSFVLNLGFTNTTTVYEANLDLTLLANATNALAIEFKGTGDANGLDFYSNIAGLKGFVELISTAHSLGTSSMINPSKIIFTKKTDTTTHFMLTN